MNNTKLVVQNAKWTVWSSFTPKTAENPIELTAYYVVLPGTRIRYGKYFQKELAQYIANSLNSQYLTIIIP